MKHLSIILISWLILSGLLPLETTVDPTGIYDLENETRKEGDDIYGYFGQIKVLAIDETTIIMDFQVCKGAPSYNSGSFLDTLEYINGQAIYTDPEIDESCRITFDFTEKGVKVTEETENYNFGCGFGHAVVADGFYKKTSSDKPTFELDR
jgi:hypothetical protein